MASIDGSATGSIVLAGADAGADMGTDSGVDCRACARTDVSGSDGIVARFTGLIRSGELPSGAEMPSIRGLAAELGVAPGTVRRAYGELESQGLIVTSAGRPSRVAEQEEAPCEVLAAVQVLVAAAHRRGVSRREVQDVIGTMWDMPAPEL
ncbi:GntR family transcriptional regulator [Bifidobacterium sp. SO4]|uniref:GntR family transcriptional regulator n=1 Tax=Bifidobacterium sp. SO4 TaxID=2809030 RepID=UPI001BDD2E41|nr:GntR family transcriptional regulator [Bifidobacterium sp. SO4]